MTRHRLLLAALLLVGVGAAGVLIWRLVPPRLPPDRPPAADGERLPADERRALAGRARRAVALLENEDLDEAIDLLAELDGALPASEFAKRNLAIALLLRLEALDPLREPERVDEVAARAQAVLDELEAISDAAAVAVLAGRLSRKRDEPAEAIERFELAAERAPGDAAIPFELWLTARDAEPEALRRRAAAALAEAHRRAPENAFVLLELLLLQAERRDPAIAETIDRIAAALEPFAGGIRDRTTADVRQLLEEAAEAVERGDWDTVTRNVRIVANVTRPDAVAQSDRRRVDRNVLHYVLTELDPDLTADLEPPSPPAIPVRFEERDALDERPEVRALLLRDVDLDGRADAITLVPGALHVDLRDPDGARSLTFEDSSGGYDGLAAADLDADVETSPAGDPEDDPAICHAADLDFVVWGAGGIRVVENRKLDDGQRILVPVESERLASLRDVSAVGLLDVDHDGDLDLLVAAGAGVSVFSNRGNLDFEDVSSRSALPDAGARITSLLPADLDRDGDLDVVVGRREGSSGWLENLRHGRLRWREVATFPPATVWEVLDVNGDGAWAVLASTDEGLLLVPTLPLREAVEWGEPQRIADGAFDSVNVWDFDNDGAVDVAAWGEAGLRLFRGTGEAFDPVDDAAGLPNEVRAFDFADLDEDGDLDVVVADTSVRPFHNEGGNANNWIRVALRAQQVRGDAASASGRVNQYGLGSLLQLRAGVEDSPHVVRRPWTHFGLGRRDAADAIRVLWTNGIPFNVVAPEANQVICERQTLKGSCPYLYAWDGERFAFVTDLLWAAPIGLQFAENVLAPARPWEYLRVPGSALAERDGHYELRITEELWEAGYFDHVALTAVDHPAEVDVFTNEKVGPAAIAQPRLHTVRNPRTPAAIRDPRGRDLLPALKSRDDVYAQAFENKVRQGLVEEHFLEIDLGELDDPQRITLFLTGWVYPTDTSLNVALSQNPELPSPQPPALRVPDANGEWKTVIPYTGFPGGKTKTVAVDLSGAFLADDFRVRLVTNMEFSWDHVFFTVDEDPAPVRERALELVSAELRYRGFSREFFPPGLGPHRYDYEDVATEPKWLPIRGGFTRYGDVRELLAETDDRLVIVGAGDEIALRFRVPDESPPPGWTRDFVLHSVGWDKDADFNTVYGETVEPLPFGSMSRYPYAPEETYPATPILQRDRERFHTRRQR